MRSSTPPRRLLSALSAMVGGAARRVGGGLCPGPAADPLPAVANFVAGADETTDTLKPMQALLQPLPVIEIFKAGTHISMSGSPVTISVPELEACARAYDPARHEAPLVIGHPKTDDPAYGWVQRLFVQGESLFAEVDDVEPTFAENVRNRRYSKVSASFWRPGAAGNPTPEVWTLKHVGFLGASAPAVKGMRTVRFSSNETGVVAFVDNDATALAERLREVEEREKALRHRGNADFAARICNEGRLLPVFVDGLVAFMDALDPAGTVSFADGGETKELPATDWLKQFLSSTPPVVSYGRVDMSSPPEDENPGVIVPAGYGVAADQGDVFRRATDYAKRHKVSFAEAVQKVGR